MKTFKIVIVLGFLIIITAVAIAIGEVNERRDQHIKWLNEETHRHSQWQWMEWRKYYGKMSNMVIYPHQFNTNVTLELSNGPGTNKIEFGFRDDGVVVWRNK